MLPKFKSSRLITQCHSYHGIPLDQLSSAVQKSVCRRNDFDTSVHFAQEWMLFVHWQEKVGPAISNFRNRIFHVAMFEDILAFTEIHRLIPILDQHEAWFDSLKNFNDVASAAYRIIQALKVFSECRKYRIGSEMNQVLFYDQDQSQFAAWLDEPQQVQRFKDFIATCLNSQEPINVQNKVLGLGKHEGGDTKYQLWPWFFYLFRPLTQEPWRVKIRSYRQIFWKHIEAFSKSHSNTLFRWYEWCYRLFMNSHESKEAYLYPLHCFLACIHRKSIPLTVTPMNNDVDTDEVQKLKEFFQSPTPPSIPVPEYAIDMHTSSGRKLGKGKSEFALVGCQLLNTDQEYFVHEWHQRYVQVRCEPERKIGEKHGNADSQQDSKKRVKHVDVQDLVFLDDTYEIPNQYIVDWKSDPNHVVLCQSVTSKWKQVTLVDYFHDIIGGESWNSRIPTYVYKGPFELLKGNTINRLKIWHHRMELFRHLGINVPISTCHREAGNPYSVWIRSPCLDPQRFEELKFLDQPRLMINGWSGRVMHREKLIRMCDAKPSDIEHHQECFRLGYLYLFVRNLFNPPIGDTGPWNILIRTSNWTPWCVDFEEESHNPEPTIMTRDNWWSAIQKRKTASLSIIEKVLGFSDPSAMRKTIDLFKNFIGVMEKPEHQTFFRLELSKMFLNFFESNL